MDTYIGDILDGADHDSRNDSFTGITKADALRFANYAQFYLFGRITRKFPRSFYQRTSNTAIPIVANQQDYTVNDNVYMGTRIVLIQYSPDGADTTFVRLYPLNPYVDANITTGRPLYYERQNGTIRIFPIQTTASGYLRVVYERALDRLDIREAQVNGAPTGATITLSSIVDSSRFAANAYVCISDFNGIPLLYNGLVTGLSGSTLSLAANVSTYLILSTTTLADLNNGYVTIGKYTSTHSQLTNDAEGFISEYVTQRLYKRDARIDDTKILASMKDLEDQIVSGYEIADKEAKGIPISDYDILVFNPVTARAVW